MALQTRSLILMGLGSLGNTPPNTIQPPLTNGIHLRWSFKRDLGFPWYGFYLFRRVSAQGTTSCLRELNQFRNLPKGPWPAPTLSIAYGQISSDRNLLLTDKFPAAGVPEIDLNTGTFVRFTFNPGEPARRVELQIGFLQAGGVDVLGLLDDTPVVQTRAVGTAGAVVSVTIEADSISTIELRQAPAVLTDLCFVPVGQNATTGWGLIPGLPYPLRLPVTQPAYPCTPGLGEQLVNARSLARSRITYGDPNQFTAAPTVLYNSRTITLTNASPIVIGSATAWNPDLVGASLQVSGETTAYTIAAVVNATRLVLSRSYAGSSGSGRTYAINRDEFSQLHDHLAVLVSGGPAAGPMQTRSLPGAAYTTGTVSVTDGIATVSGTGTTWNPNHQGLAFEVVHTSAGTATLVNGSSVVTGAGTNWGSNLQRMRFQVAGEPAQYTIVQVDSPTQLTLDRSYSGPSAGGKAFTIIDNSSYTIAQVNSPTRLTLNRSYAGPSGGGKTYRIFAGLQAIDPDGGAPAMPRQYPLDLVLLAALHPAIAQMVGLYWVDQSAAQGTSYDYLIVADYANKANLNPQQMLTYIQQSGFAEIEGSIVFNKRVAATAALAPPEGLKVYALPGCDVREGNFTSNSAGLDWSIGVDSLGVLLPGRAVLYHLWRAALGASEPAAPPLANQYQLLTTNGPLLVTQPQLPDNELPQRPLDWPPFPLPIIDKGLVDGWYSYQLSGIDIFGRHSARSAAAQWYQWGPMPTPRPWYYRDPPGPQAIRPFAVRILDTIPPPPPTGVEAYALDPDDPTILQDTVYTAWQATLSAAERASVIGLRVRWQWTHAHMLQAPDTQEFRIYYHTGTQLPAPDHSITTSWDKRIYVVGYNEHVTVTTDAGGHPLRKYEVLLPAAGDTYRDGLQLNPTPAAPIVYAHIGVSAADDKANEGRITAPARIFRVLRTPPQPPTPPPDGERVYATPADYHGHSFYTYRWQKVDFLKTHICRALDDTLFKVDWARRPRPALTGGESGIFPSEPRWDTLKRQQVAADLNALNSFSHNAAGKAQAMAAYRGLSNDALRVLAGLSDNERAFTQLTIAPLDPDDPANVYTPDPNLRAYVDRLDGRASNRYLYRAAYVAGAHNRSQLSLASAPVWLPDVVPPRTPSITRATGGDRQLTIAWALNREPDLSEYRLYRAEYELAERALVSAVPVHIRAAGSIPAGSAEISWDDTGIQGLVNYHYCLVAVDTTGNVSAPARVMARAYDDALPVVPPLSVVWTATTPAVARATWTATEETLLERQSLVNPVWDRVTDWRTPGMHTVDVTVSDDYTWNFRLRIRKATGALAIGTTFTLDRRA